ncbi:response regulator [Pedobacter insulae]|uniref:DNA-binding response regulator, NarL/FixJ family, contains REC and HTH domains n=1 Tax=Pedobacter insulae TaxID=414048 RepID=A0A1I2X064_9SPHI|nr:response regulator transcription factor [Pedobacter insulae]SFH06076.1 DNA-binding response regulator, NarL/FixJ family, contains REC and HTH domains [Pedobacter insulae]
MNNAVINTIIVDDHLLFAEGLSLILHDIPHLHLLKIVNSYNGVAGMFSQYHIDLILLDIKLRDENGIDICFLVKELYPDVKIILISMFDPDSLAVEIKKCNANGYIPKSTNAQVVKATICKILAGENVFLDLGSKNVKETPLEKLITPREREIIALIKQGKSAKEISCLLNISVFTVDTHRKNILKKLELNSIKDLIAFSVSNNL